MNFSNTGQVSDSPTNNFCTINSIDADGGLSVQGAGLNMTSTNGNEGSVGCTFLMPLEGKYYFELTQNLTGTSQAGVGFETDGDARTDDTRANDFWGYHDNGAKLEDGTETISFSTWDTSGDIIGVAADIDGDSIEFFKNNVSEFTITTLDFQAIRTVPSLCDTGAAHDVDITVNFGQRALTYTPPTDHVSLSAENLPEPTIGPNAATQAGDHFKAITYTGNGGTNNVTGVGFQPDFVWIKRRSGAGSFHVYDALRGATKAMFTDVNNAETTDSNGLTSFDSDGFTLGTTTAVNNNGDDYVAWCWKADNTTGASNTDGSITSTVATNDTSKFSIVTYTGNGVAGATVGHGLGVVPALIIIKRRDSAGSWNVYHHENTDAPETDYLTLETTNATIDNAGPHNDTAPTASVFSLGTAAWTNTNTGTYVAYCFAEVEGFSRFGSYDGTNSASNGAHFTTGFRPAFVMTKSTNAASSWPILDAARDPDNQVNNRLIADNSAGEGVAHECDFLANGVKWRSADTGSNLNHTHIFVAFAEQPFKNSNAR